MLREVRDTAHEMVGAQFSSQLGGGADLSVQLLEGRPQITVDENGGLC